MPLGFGDGGFDGLLKKAAASAKVLAKDAVKGGSSLVSKVAEPSPELRLKLADSQTDVKSTARRLTNKVMEKAEGSQFTLVEELPEVESAMVNLKQTDAAYRELLAVLKESFIAQGKAVARQQRVANRAEVIGRDLEGEELGAALCSYSSHLVACAEKGQGLNGIKDAAEVEERAQDDFDYRVYDTPAARLVFALESFLRQELEQALEARTKYKDTRREVSLNAKKAQDLEAKGQADKAPALRQQIEEQTASMAADREELMRLFMAAEQQKPALQSSVQSYLQAQLQYHRECAESADKATAALSSRQ